MLKPTLAYLEGGIMDFVLQVTYMEYVNFQFSHLAMTKYDNALHLESLNLKEQLPPLISCMLYGF